MSSTGTGTRNGMGVAALVVGIFAVITCWTLIGGILLGVLALIFGLVGRSRAKRGEATNGGAALAGSILGSIGLVVAIVFIIVGATFLFHHKKAFHNLESCDQHATSQAQKDSCNREFSHQVNSGQ